ncbi:AraC family transcriptional regulator [Sutterella sp.]|uniref:AraC family transcriptional regulator n=1 Tax=Sutterella sp. TaxID=1981025 RepID=UPI0026DFA7E0|nr:AraC family transcriptional regulator [Sutterella sp.]MDO5531366.1 AraC family transcriptional regulator [Sutterella sp.]
MTEETKPRRETAEIESMEDEALLPLGDSILASWIRSICQTVRGYGVSPETILERTGLDASLLTVPDARFPAMNVRRFWEAVISATGDELIGLRCGQEMQVATLHGLGLAIVTSHSLAQVLELTARYGKIVSTTMDMSLEHDGSGSTLHLRTLHGYEARHAALLCIIAFIERQACSLAQHRVTPIAVGVRLPKASASDRARLEEYFGCAVDTNPAGTDYIRFAYTDVMEPYAGQNAMLREANEQVVRQYLNRVRQFSFTVRVEEEIEEMLKAGESVRIGDVASRLNLSARTLQRRLEGEGAVFMHLVDKHRKQLAHDALAHTERTITEIAYTIGFSDPSNFSRTCARWFGCSPAAYRRRIRQLPT